MIIAAALAVVPAPAGAAGRVIHGEWFPGRSTHFCLGSATNFECRHTATSLQSFVSGVPATCQESDPTTGQPLRNGCSAVLRPESSLAYVRTFGAGVNGNCATTRATNGAVPVVRIFSSVLMTSFDVPVNILNNEGVSTISGTLVTATATVQVAGRWTNGCDSFLLDQVPAVGAFTGTFDISI